MIAVGNSALRIGWWPGAAHGMVEDVEVGHSCGALLHALNAGGGQYEAGFLSESRTNKSGGEACALLSFNNKSLVAQGGLQARCATTRSEEEEEGLVSWPSLNRKFDPGAGIAPKAH